MLGLKLIYESVILKSDIKVKEGNINALMFYYKFNFFGKNTPFFLYELHKSDLSLAIFKNSVKVTLKYS